MKIMRFALIALSVVMMLALVACAAAEETTTAAPAVTTAAPEATTTAAGTTAAAEEKSGCGAFVVALPVVAIGAVAGTVLVLRKKNDEE